MPTPVSCTAISTSPPATLARPTDTTASAPACSSALSSRLPSTTSSRRGATGTRRPRAATNRRSRLRQVRRARRSATTASARGAGVGVLAGRDLAAVERGQQQHLVDQAAHRVDLDLDLHDERLALGVGLRQLERLGQAEDARQRRAQLVRDGGREQAPRLAEVARRRHVDQHGERAPSACARRCTSHRRRTGSSTVISRSTTAAPPSTSATSGRSGAGIALVGEGGRAPRRWSGARVPARSNWTTGVGAASSRASSEASVDSQLRARARGPPSSCSQGARCARRSRAQPR